MVTLQILVLPFLVRVRVAQQKKNRCIASVLLLLLFTFSLFRASDIADPIFLLALDYSSVTERMSAKFMSKMRVE